MMARALLVLAGTALFASTAYQNEIDAWRKAREASLKRDDGWLTVSGLFWLKDGVNRIGKDAANSIVLPDGPARAGTLTLRGGKVTANAGGAARELKPDSGDFLKVGRLSLYIIKRGDRIGVRMKDPESQYLKNFHGIPAFPANEAYKITARFVAEPRKIPITNVLGQTEAEDSPGYAAFRLNGQDVRLYPVIDDPGDKSLFFIFKDLTSGKETYGAGRFLDTEAPHDGKVVLDFNKAYNPPCAFTAYATCPLPPKENRLPVRVEAGEKTYGH
ncbi:MAG TPA: DUF1684 domain-containing protein [Bryobacteraceae bacterium]|nr:DUF1684 domain-containing protein [Bryobacteraceae bacterium]